LLGQLLVGSLVSAIAIMVHALATVGAIGVVRGARQWRIIYPRTPEGRERGPGERL
jgi:hypothetical protein